MPDRTYLHKTVDFADVPKWKPAAMRSHRVILLLAGYAGMCIGGLTTPFATGQVRGPHIAYEHRIERGMRELRRMSPADRSEVIRRVRNGFAPADKELQERRLKVLGALDHQGWNTSEPSGSPTRGTTLFLDVKNENGRISVGTRGAADYWLQEMELENWTPTWHSVDSAEEFHRLLGDATTVVHQGDSLPEQWRNPLLRKDLYLRNSYASPKKSFYEYIRAAQILDRRPQPGRVRILSALPQATGIIDSYLELSRMGLSVTEASGWRDLKKQMSQLQAELRVNQFSLDEPRVEEHQEQPVFHLRFVSEHKIEAATKQAFVGELANGTNDYVVLIAHFDGKQLHFPDGSTMTREELAAVKREAAPERTLVLISCEAGSVNEPLESLAEIALRNKLAMNVVAPPQPVSAAQVPDLLRRYLMQSKSINEVFVTPGNFHNITENLDVPRYGGMPLLIQKQESKSKSKSGLSSNS